MCKYIRAFFIYFNIPLQDTARTQSKMTLQDLYNQNGFDIEEDDDDSDWEPMQKHVDVVKWFCRNCTVVNSGRAIHCDVCP